MLMEKKLFAKSSDGINSYSVHFIIQEDKLSIFCDCPAGEWGKFCKHKLALLRNEKDMLFNRDQEKELAEVQNWVRQSKYPDMLEKLDSAEREAKKANAELKKAKKSFENAMKSGT